MKQLRKSILVFICSLALALVMLCACGGEKQYTLTLELDGGTLSSSTLTLKEGENVYDAVKDLVPSKDGYVFEGWYEGDSPLAQDRTMTGDLSIQAHYSEETKPAAGRIVYHTNAPQGYSVTGRVADTVAGEDGKATVANGTFNAVGCRFLGWSTDSRGTVTHLPGQEVSPEGTLDLYAVWQRGLSDRFGGNDYIFADGDKAILQRGGVEFEGTLDGDIFTFQTPSGDVKGKIFPLSNAFSYAQEGFAGSFVFNSAYDGRTDTTDVLTLDEYGAGTHTYTENGAAVSDGGYVVPGPVTIDNESGEVMSVQYIFRIDSGVNAGTEFGFRIAQAGGRKVFQSTFGEAGYYTQYDTPNGVTFFPAGGDATLDGFGGISFGYAPDSFNYIPFDGTYTVLGWTDNGGGALYRIDAKLRDYNNLASQLGFEVTDGFFTLSFYTIPLQGDVYAFVEPGAEAGTYSVGDGGSLTLDGFFNFTDSAVYTDAQGVRHTGMYTVAETPERDWIITLNVSNENGIPTGERYSFRIALRGTTGDGATLFDAEEVPMEYLHLAPGSFDYDLVLAVSYEPDETVEGAFQAQLLRQTAAGSSQYAAASEGYVSVQTLTGGGFNLFTYHETRRLLTDGELPISFVFMTGSAYDNNYLTHDVYYVFEYTYSRGGEEVTEKQYAEVTDEEDSGEKIWYMDLGFGGVGAIYFTEDVAYAGSFSVDTSGYYMGPVGTFVGIDPDTNMQVTFYFDVQIGDGVSTFRRISETEYPVFTGFSDGTVDGNVVRLLLRGDEAMYSVDGTFGEGSVRGTLQDVGTNPFGEDIVQLVDDSGAVRLSFLLSYESIEIPITPYFSYYEVNWVYYMLNEAIAGTYTSNGETLLVDGYHKASFTDASGKSVESSYSYQGGVLSFKPATQGQFLLGQDKTFTRLDGAYGERDLFYKNRWFTVSFDGRGNLTLKIEQQTVGAGLYEVDDPAASIFDLFINFNEPYSEFLGDGASIRVAPGSAGLVVLDAELANVFIGQDWSVLRLDGHGGGSYFDAADGSVSQIYYDLISAEDGYLHLRGTDLNVLIDKANKTFTLPASAEHVLFYGSDFSALEFGPSGTLYTDRNTCYYRIDGNKTILYLAEQFSEFYERIVVEGTPSRNTNLTVGDVAYYPYTAGRSVTFTGSVELKDDEAGINVNYNASLTFTPDGNLQFEFGAVRGRFIVGDEQYTVYVVNSYYDYLTGKQCGLSLCDLNTYEYSPFTEYKYDPDGQSTFRVKGGRVDTVLYDGSEDVTVPEEQSSRLTESRVGFGPIVLSDPVLSGVVHADGETFTFSNAKPILVQNAGGTDVRYMATFTQNETAYAIYYIKEGGYYRLYMLATYSETEADGYTVGVGAFYYSNGYEFPEHVKKGTPFALTLFEGTGENKTPIVAFNQFVNFDGKSGWVLALGGYNPQADSGSLGSIYTVTLGQTCSVKAYTVKQAVGTIEGASAAVNLCLDGDGNVVAPVSIMRDSGDGTYEFYYFTTVEKEGDNTWVFHSAEGIEDVAITLLTDENGEYIEDGEYWTIECEYRDPAV